MISEIARPLQVVQVIDIHPVPGNILHLGRMAVIDQPVDQVGHAHAFKSIFSTELTEGFG